MKLASYIFSIAAFSAATVFASPILLGESNLLDLLLSPKGLLGTHGLVSDILGKLGLSDYNTGIFTPYDEDGTPGQPQPIATYPYSTSAPEGYTFVSSDSYDHDLLQLLLGQNGLLGTHSLVSDILGTLGLSDYNAGTYIPIYQVSGQNSYVTGPYTQFPSSASGPYNSDPSDGSDPTPYGYGSDPSDASNPVPYDDGSNPAPYNDDSNPAPYDDGSNPAPYDDGSNPVPYDDGSNPSGDSYSSGGFPFGSFPFSSPGGDFLPIDFHNNDLVNKILGEGSLLSTSGLVCDILSKVGLCRLSDHIGYVSLFHSAEKGDVIYSLPFNPYH